jgi:hypothetical protein
VSEVLRFCTSAGFWERLSGMLEDLDLLDAAVDDTTVFGRIGGRRPGSAAARVQVVALPVRVRDVRRLASATEH